MVYNLGMTPDERREYDRNWYHANKERRIEQIRKDKKRRMQEVRRKVLDYLREHPCVDCGETDPVVLEFDHRNPAEKTDNIARMLSISAVWPKVLLEIEKCDVRCANCHRRRTAIQFGWYSFMEGLIASEVP